MLAFDWIKQFFGLGKVENTPPVVEAPVVQPKEVIVTESPKKEEPQVDYNTMTRGQLMSLAKQRGIAVKPTTKKQELIEVLK